MLEPVEAAVLTRPQRRLRLRGLCPSRPGGLHERSRDGRPARHHHDPCRCPRDRAPARRPARRQRRDAEHRRHRSGDRRAVHGPADRLLRRCRGPAGVSRRLPGHTVPGNDARAAGAEAAVGWLLLHVHQPDDDARRRVHRCLAVLPDLPPGGRPGEHVHGGTRSTRHCTRTTTRPSPGGRSP